MGHTQVGTNFKIFCEIFKLLIPKTIHLHDLLVKVCPLLEMCQTNFCLRYTPARYISLDESTMTFKGRVKFLQFNPSKPNKFHIKLFMVLEHLSGYISGFSVYTRKIANEVVTEKATLDLYCSITTKTVMGLLQKTKLLDNHHTVFRQLLQFV